MTAINEVTDLTIDGGVAVVTIDYPPVNALAPQVLEGLYDATVSAINDDAAKALLLICAGRTFIAGADIKSLGKAKPKVDFFECQAFIENAKKPFVAAIHGTCLGGGLEVALTCHYRVAVPSARLGLPEVNLGLLPGGGGTQRLPRIVGVPAALDLLVSGRQVKAPEALELGLIDALMDGQDLRAEAIAYVRGLIADQKPAKRVRDLTDKIGGTEASVFAAARQNAALKRRGQTAPEAIIRCVEAAALGDFDKGLAVERSEFQGVLTGPQSAALRYVFLAEREAAKVPGIDPKAPTPPIAGVAVIGSGPTAAAIGKSFNDAGLSVTIIGEAQLSALKPSDIADRDLVIEATPADIATRKDIFAKLALAAKGEASLAAYGSDIDLSEIAGATAKPEQVFGLNLATPLDGTRVLEIARRSTTALAVIAAALALARKIGKVGVVSVASPGLIGERMRTVLQAQADRLVSAGTPLPEINRVLYDFGFSLDPLTKQSFGERPAAANAGSTPQADAEILAQLLYPLINEGALILENGIAQRASDIDIVWTLGYGWPDYHGGPMYYADVIGLDIIVGALKAMGVEAAPLLLKNAAERHGFTKEG